MKQLFSLIAIMIGALSLAAQPSSCFSLSLANETGNPGDTVCLDVTVDEFNEIVGMQYSFAWDPSQLALIEVNDFNLPSLSASNFNLEPASLANGQSALSWFDLTNPDGVSLADGSVIYSMCFEVLSTTSGTQLEVAFSGSPTPVEIVNGDTENLSLLSLINGGIAVNGNTPLLSIDSICLDGGSCGADKSASISVSGGQPNYTFNWMDENGISVATTQNLTDVANGQYTVEVTDAAGMTATASCTIDAGNGLTTAFNYACTDDTADVSVVVWAGGTPPYSFAWSNGETASDSLISSIHGVEDETDYSVTITSTDGCTEVVEIPAFDCNPPPQFLVAHSYECTFFADLPSVAELTVVVWTGGEPPYTYEWSTGAVTSQENPAVAYSSIFVPGNGTYYVTITDSQGVEHEHGPMVVECDPADPIDLSSSVECLTDTAEVTVTATGGIAPYTFDWDNGYTENSSSTSTQLLDDGTYSITVTDANGTSETSSVNVNCDQSGGDWLLAHSINCTFYPDSDTTVADVSVVVWVGGTLPYTYTWSTGETQTIADPAYPVGTITADGDGTYSVTITDANGISEEYGPIEPNCSMLDDGISLFVDDAEVAPGEHFCVDVTVADFEDIVSLQFSMNWDEDVIDFDSLVPGSALPSFDHNSFNLNNTSDGYLIMSWFNPSVQAVTLPDDAVLFSLCFTASANGGTTQVEITSTPAAIEATDENTNTVNVNVFDGNINVESENVNLSYGIECLTDSTVVTVTTTGGTPPYNYNWSNGYTETTSGPSTQSLEDGTYTVTVTDLESTIETLSIDVNCDQSGGDWLIANSYECQLYPDTAIADIHVVVWSGGTLPYTYEWSTGETQTVSDPSLPIGTITVDGNGTYSVTITDANGISQVHGPIEPDCGMATDGISLFVDDAEVMPEESFCVDVTVADFENIVSLQFSMNWDADIIHFDNLVLGNALPSFNNNSFNLNNTNDGYLTMSWFNQSIQPVTLPDDAVLFSLCFTASANGGTTQVEITSIPTAIEATDENINAVNVYVYDGNINVSSENVDLSYEIECLTDSTVVTVTTTGGTPPYNYNWSNGYTETTSGPSTQSLEDGTYTVTVTDIESTIETLSIEVNCDQSGGDWLIANSYECQLYPDTAIADIHVVVWSGGTLPYTYEWSTGEVQTISDPSLPIGTITADGNGTYSVTITDANGVIQTHGPIVPDCGVASDGISLFVGDAEVSAEESFCVDVTVANFEDIVSLQFSMNWDADSIHFDSLVLGNALPMFNNSNFNLNNTSNGYLVMSWFQLSIQPVTLPDDAVLFSLCFTAAANGGTTQIEITSTPTVIEATDENTNSVNVYTYDGDITVLPPEVWPGDTDTDGTVSHFDLLNIGLSYGATGPSRPGATTDWVGQYADNWGQTTPVSEVDFKHMDTNGDGLIDADDTLALSLNWGEENFFGGPQEEEIRSSGTVIYVQPDTLILGAENVFNIVMGHTDTPAEDVYGVAFTIVYDTAAVEPETAYASFLDSWLGDINEDMLSFYHDRYENGRIDIAITRTDGINITGEGAIGQLHITIQDVIFMRNENYELIFNIENVRLIDYQENTIEITPEESVSIIKDAISNTNEPDEQSKVIAYPNPTDNHLYLLTDDIVEQVELLTMDGKSVYQANYTSEIATHLLSSGNYILKVWTNKGFSLHRIAIVK
ncbi:MAG: cohesin domain-containing protein [Chitinophagales bacterium]|nr:cohesin domain-containing protein [Chitinophagales bacterium]